MHLSVDCFYGDSAKLNDEELVREALARYPIMLGGGQVADPQVQRYVGSEPEDWGVSGFVLGYDPSHISIQTFPENRYMWVDIFSVKQYEEPQLEEIYKDLKDTFGFTEVKPQILKRGLEYPHVIAEELPIRDQLSANHQ
jgi:S-adenosylmethionine decarboxylase